MKIKSFFKLVEIQTKTASVIPFLLGTSYSLYRFRSFNLKNFLLMLVSLLCIDMATTAINNYMDFRRANRKYGYGYESHNAIVRDKLKEPAVLTAISFLLVIAVVSGILLFLNTNIVVLLLGAASFAIGILYSFGPLPISRTPFGELLSGIFMGMVITFMAVYIHVFQGSLLTLSLDGSLLGLSMNLPETIYILLLAMPAAAGIANIMLANNICDLEDDLENRRYTLVVFIGRSWALLVFELLYYTGFAALAFLLVIGAAPLISAVTLLALIPVYRNISRFKEKQSKKDTFVLSVKNFVLTNCLLVLTIVVSTIPRLA